MSLKCVIKSLQRSKDISRYLFSIFLL